jgi:integral membrane protein (TIGR01906 family)
MKWFVWIAQALIVLTVPLVLLVGSVRLLMLPIVMQWEYQRPDFEVDYYGFTTQDRLDYAPLALTYLLTSEPIEYLARQTLTGDKCFPPQDTPCPMFKANELKHMEDVKNVTVFLFSLTFVLASLALVGAIFLIRRGSFLVVKNSLTYGAILTIVLIVTGALVVVFAWDTFFATFHGLFFADGTWTFYYSDTLIRLYPEQFWMDMSIAVGVLAIVGALVILFGASRVTLARRTIDPL